MIFTNEILLMRCTRTMKENIDTENGNCNVMTFHMLPAPPGQHLPFFLICFDGELTTIMVYLQTTFCNTVVGQKLN